MTEKDKELIKKAHSQKWEDIDENLAETEAGREALHNIATRKWHLEECRCGIG